jgi:threonine/homoserine/homoserine lactone efflux protein
MTAYFLQGIQIGLGLALLVGPIIVLLIQLSLEEGTLSSVFAGLGIWVSDFLFIMAAHFGLGKLRLLIDNPHFEEIIGTVGGIVLIVVGISMYLRRPIEFGEKLEKRPANYWLSFIKGFGINTFNPFPVFFWSAVSVGVVYEEQLNSNETLVLYAGIIGTVILTDVIKIGAARYLRRWMTIKHTRLVQRIGAVALMLFGVVLWIQVWV